MFQKDIGRAVEEDDEGFGEFRRGNKGLTRVDDSNRWFDIPGPAILGEATHPAAESKQTVPEEYSTFYRVRKATEDAMAALVGR